MCPKNGNQAVEGSRDEVGMNFFRREKKMLRGASLLLNNYLIGCSEVEIGLVSQATSNRTR